jgi:CBS domain-containing protein
MQNKKSQYVVSPRASLKEALALIDQNAHRSLIVVGEGGIVVGTLSDGDVRKALLDGHLLETPVGDVMNTNFVSLRPEKTSEAKALFERHRIFLIPVVSADGKLKDVLEAY